jgi:hypothetical protein
VCKSKENGGLGVRVLQVQNECLQVKLLHRIHSAARSSWPRWVWSSLHGAFIDDLRATTVLCGPHWSSLRRLLPLYRSITSVRVGGGASTSFWHDAWLPLGALSLALPELYTHCLNPQATVASALSSGIDGTVLSEDAEHVVVGCPFAIRFWASIGAYPQTR